MTVAYLDLADFLTIAEVVLGAPAETLTRVADLGLADSALHAPAAGFGKEELSPNLALKAAVLCAPGQEPPSPVGGETPPDVTVRRQIPESGGSGRRVRRASSAPADLVDAAVGLQDRNKRLALVCTIEFCARKTTSKTRRVYQ